MLGDCLPASEQLPEQRGAGVQEDHDGLIWLPPGAAAAALWAAGRAFGWRGGAPSGGTLLIWRGGGQVM